MPCSPERAISGGKAIGGCFRVQGCPDGRARIGTPEIVAKTLDFPCPINAPGQNHAHFVRARLKGSSSPSLFAGLSQTEQRMRCARLGNIRRTRAVGLTAKPNGHSRPATLTCASDKKANHVPDF